MRPVTDERGAALVMALILSLIVLAAVSAMLYLVTQGTEISGFQKRYQTAQEAAKGGMELATREVISRTIASAYLDNIEGTDDNLIAMKTSVGSDYSEISLTFPPATSTACLRNKLLLSAITGTTKNWTSCTNDNYSLDLKKPDGTNISDMTFTLSGTPGAADFKVYAKIVDTVAGNTDTSGLDLIADGGTTGAPSPAPPTNPYLFRVELMGERTSNPDEHSRLSVLYAY
jgi:hypothetical protein